MNKQPIVSVVMSVYNGQKYLKEAMESILSQTYTNIELIVINDNSSDQSLNIINNFKDLDKRIILLNNEKNLGLTNSLIKGINNSRGKYIARIDADDIMLPNRINFQLDFISKCNADVCFCNGFKLEENIRGNIFPQMDWIVRCWRGLFTNTYGLHSSAFFVKEKIINIGGYDSSYIFAQDYELWDRCLNNNLKFAYLSSPLIKYRSHDDRLSIKHLIEQNYFAEKVSLRALKRFLPESTNTELVELKNFYQKAENNNNLNTFFVLQLLLSLLEKFLAIFPTTEHYKIWRDVFYLLNYWLTKNKHYQSKFYVKSFVFSILKSMKF